MSLRFFARAVAALLATVLVIAGGLLVAYLTLATWVPTPVGSGLLGWVIEQATGLDLEIGSVRRDARHRGVFKGDGPALTISDLRVRSSDGYPLLSAARVDLALSPRPLLAGRLAVVSVESFTMHIEGSGAQPAAAKPGAALTLPFDEFRASDGRLLLGGSAPFDEIVIQRLLLRRTGGAFAVSGGLQVAGAELALGGRLAAGGAAEDLELTASAGALARLAVESGLDAGTQARQFLAQVEGKACINGSLSDSPNVVVQIHSNFDEATEEGVRGGLTADFRLHGAELRGSLAASDVEVRDGFGTLAIASATAEFRIDLFGDERWMEVSRVELTGLAGHDTAFSHGAEGISLGGDLAVQLGDLPQRRIRGSLSIAAGELLWQRFYGSFREHPASLDFDAELLSARAAAADAPVLRGVKLEQAKLSVAGLGQASLLGRYDPVGRRLAVELRADLPQSADAYALFVREPFAGRYPFLAQLSAEGSLAADLSCVVGPSGLETLSGWLKGRGVVVRSSDGRWSIEGGRWSLPVAISERAVPRKPDSGSVQFDSAVLAGIPVAALKLPLTVRSNAVDGNGEVEVRLLGGSIRISSLQFRELQSAARKVRFALEVSGLELGKLASSQELPSLEGSLSGRLDSVTVTAKSVATKGSLTASLLGGRATLTNLGITGLSSSIATLHLDANVEGVDLARATRLLGVGRVSGIAQGEVHDLQLAAGEPVHFDARFETVPTRGVAQRISVRAIEQLSVLGGSGSSPVTRGILSFFDEYRYAKMGLRCSLRNDRFILRGVERLKEKDFLVVGTFMPPTVNVISHNQIIAFKDMVGRIERIVAVGEAETR